MSLSVHLCPKILYWTCFKPTGPPCCSSPLLANSYVYTFEDYYELSNATSLYEVNPDTQPCTANLQHSIVGVILSIILVGIFLLAIPGNLLVGFVIGSSRQRLTPSDVYLFHLTVADGLLALTLPLWAHSVANGWVFGDVMCKLLSLVKEVSFYTSMLFLVCISVDRYLAIVYAAAASNRRWACSWIVCASIWMLGGVLSLPALFNKAFKASNGSEWITCDEQFGLGDADQWQLATRGLRHVLGFLVPLVVMGMCYGVTLARLLRTSGFQKHRAMRVIVAVVMAFLLCWMPYNVAVITDTLHRAKMVDLDCQARISLDLALLVTHSLALSHCCINPFLYAFVGERFRGNLVALVKKRRRSERRSMSMPRFSRSTSQTSEGQGQFM